MPGDDDVLMNDDLFHKTISCPLKYLYLTKKQELRKPPGLLFRQRNKLHVRDAIARQFQNCKHTSNSVEKAREETARWMNLHSVAICGAVIRHKRLLTRIPILLKNDSELTIIQVHGRLLKRSEGNKIELSNQKRSIQRYLLKAAYRLEIVQRQFPAHTIKVDFYFPDKHYKSTSENLHLFKKRDKIDEKLTQKEFSKLFSNVEATNATFEVRQRIPDSISHEKFKGLSVTDALKMMSGFGTETSWSEHFKRHSGCKYCDFRLPENQDIESCWGKYFQQDEIQHPDKHVFELIGHGNSVESENGSFYQEEAQLSNGFQSFEDAKKYGGRNITILQRRNLQILQAMGKPVSALWMKPGIKMVDSLQFPLHFLDFEAATYAIPMKEQVRAYDPVYFQFSCFTLSKNGDIVHTEWIDQQPGEIHPHREFVNRLGSIPNIFRGTIMQYSPFEKQSINRLIGNLRRKPKQFKNQIQVLEKIRRTNLPGREDRFFDMSKIIRDFYFNKFLTNGLGLKPVLSRILQWERAEGEGDLLKMPMDTGYVDLNDYFDLGEIPDPYELIQNSDYQISDGSAAMNAWIAFKNGLLTENEKRELPNILKKYCALDSYALVILYYHLKKFAKKIGENDLIKF